MVEELPLFFSMVIFNTAHVVVAARRDYAYEAEDWSYRYAGGCADT